jgi:hypothetical protein
MWGLQLGAFYIAEPAGAQMAPAGRCGAGLCCGDECGMHDEARWMPRRSTKKTRVGCGQVAERVRLNLYDVDWDCHRLHRLL